MAACPACGHPASPTARFCSRCGARLAAPESAAVAPQAFLAAPASPFIVHEPAPPGGALLEPLSGRQQALFGFELLALPDWISAPTITGETEAQKQQAALQSWQEVVANLWKWQASAVSLRFVSRPERGQVEMALLGRVRADANVPGIAAALAQDLHAQFAALHLDARPLRTPEALARARRPVPLEALAEVRQQESVVELTLGDAYIVYPLRAPAGDFRLVFEALMATPVPTMLALHLEPVRLTPLEQGELARAAAVAQSLSDFQYTGLYFQGRWQDPQAGLVGRIYIDQARRLVQPFLVAAHAAGQDPVAVMTVARALANALATAPAPPQQPAGPAPVPVACEVATPRSAAEAQALHGAIGDLALQQWGHTLATAGKERLRYLTDAAGAASLVRFPVVPRAATPGVQVRQVAPSFDQGIRQTAAAPDALSLGTFLSGGVASIRLADLVRHGLVVGFTGSGKTNTCLYLVDQLWRQHRLPVLVIEPAKAEYRGLIERPGFEELLVFTLGDEAVSPFRLNPFELLPGVRLEAHLAALKTCLNAALPQFGVLPSIVEEALIKVYQDRGWELTDQGEAQPDRLFPTLRDLYAAVIRVAESRGYAGEIRDNIRAAAAGRIGSLLLGSKGLMFDCQRSIPLDLLLTRPVVLELDNLTDNEKSLVMMFLMTFLREHCRTQRRSSRLAHVTLVEEAHRILEDVASVAGSEVAADTRAEAVRFISGVLAEIRAYGESLLIAEQSPGKLAPDAVRNTNLKLSHMLLDQHDRQAIAAAMIMDEAQQTFLGKLPVGQAAVFMTGYEKATFLRVPPYKDDAYADHLPDAALEAHMRRFRAAHAQAYLPFDGCRHCGSPCRYRKAIGPVTLDRALHAAFRDALLTFDTRPAPEDDARNWAEIAYACKLAAARAGHATAPDAAYCYFAHEIDFGVNAYMRGRFLAAYTHLEAGL